MDGLRLRLLIVSGWVALFSSDCDLLVLGLPTGLRTGWLASK